MSIGTGHNIAKAVVPGVQDINQAQDLSNVRVGVRDELFQGSPPILAGPVQYDGTEDGVAAELVAAGIPHNAIVLGFRPPEVRPFTGFAVD
ncbi:FdxN element excision controlling factor protein like [Candidatus Vecturithrix granuli]|uniref:FdxN element excision controlling factor protein like n=1 Tax=Vecturithrix granuli TaxID=1499967 RepID=A0A081BVW9_VECG1|nr:FdxN element excision controlling factor protein like [Candidatus Vecturithrix granuli]